MLSMKEIPYRSTDSIEAEGLSIKNAVIAKIGIEVIGHFGNVVTLPIVVQRGCMCCDFMGGYTLTKHIGTVIQVLFDVLEIKDENGVLLESLKGKPLRMVIKGESYIGFGNFINDNKIVLLDDLFAAIKRSENEER